MRTLVDLPESDIQALDKISQRRKRSRAAVIREAVASYIKTNQSDSIDDAFGLWKHKKFDSIEYQRKLRDEW
jgi:metal-responsive CopG/Arc/MetJ family transcriptional regulator